MADILNVTIEDDRTKLQTLRLADLLRLAEANGLKPQQWWRKDDVLAALGGAAVSPVVTKTVKAN